MASRKVNKDISKNNKSRPAAQNAAPVPELAQTSGFSLNHIRMTVVLLFAFILYGNTISLSYAIDDAIVITSNQFTKKGLSGIKDIMTKDTFHGFFGENKQLVSGGRYRPLSLVTFAIEQALFKESPAISHFINVILYGLTGLVLLKLLEKLVKRKPNDKQILDLPLLTTLLFMAHPLHTEVVANIKGRDEILSLLLSLTATYLLLLYNEKQKLYLFILSCVVFFLGTLSKENALTFVLIMPAMFYVFTDIPLKTIIIRTIPYFLIFMLFWYLRAKFTGGSVNMTVTEVLNNPFVYMTSAQKLATIVYTWGKYIILLLFPHPLTHDYYYNQITTKYWSDPLVLISALVNIAWMVFGIVGVYRKSIAGLAAFIYWCEFSVVSNLVFPIGTTMSERFAYGSSLGFCLIVAFFILKMKGESFKIGENEYKLQKSVLIIALLLLVPYTAKTISRNPAWQDNYTLFTTDIKTSPNSAKLLNSIGGETMNKADAEKDTVLQKKMYQESMDYLNRALKIYPQYSIAWMLLGNNYFKSKHDYAMAVTCYQNSVLYNPNADAYYNLAITQRQLGRFDDACKNFRLLLNFRPSDPGTLYNLGDAYKKRNRPDSAIMCFQRVAQLDPKYVGIYRDLGTTFGQMKNDLPNAILYLNKALEQDPKDGSAMENLGIAYGMTKDYPNAVRVLNMAIERNPRNPNLYKNLAVTYLQLGEKQKADAAFARANQIISGK